MNSFKERNHSDLPLRIFLSQKGGGLDCEPMLKKFVPGAAIIGNFDLKNDTIRSVQRAKRSMSTKSYTKLDFFNKMTSMNLKNMDE